MRQVDSYMKGYPPKTAVGKGNPEAAKYGKLWDTKEYREVSPGERFVIYFLQQAKPKQGSHVLDLGCGTGRAALELLSTGLKVTMMDFVRNCLDEGVFGKLGDDLKFVKHDLENPIPVVAEYGFCCDVMEHIPPENVDRVLANILRSVKHCFFAISLKDDVRGHLIGEKLHLTVQPYEWWLNKLTQNFSCVVHWSEEIGTYGFFYVTAWEDAQTIVDMGKLNESEEVIRENVRVNCAQGYHQVIPHPTNDIEVMIVGSGPTLSQFEEEIRERRKAGMHLVTLNGSYNWALDKGLGPVTQIMVDAREFNARFTKPVDEKSLYLLSSQCHPSVFEGLPKSRVFLWHTMSEVTKDLINENYKTAFPIPGGSTVLLRAIPLLRMLGYRRFHIYGCDSCIIDGEHHSISQPENDGQAVVPAIVSGKDMESRAFYCNPWMMSQAREFISLIELMGEEFALQVHGDGLLAYIANNWSDMIDVSTAKEE